jgi:hypothetical protein
MSSTLSPAMRNVLGFLALRGASGNVTHAATLAALERRGLATSSHGIYRPSPAGYRAAATIQAREAFPGESLPIGSPIEDPTPWGLYVHAARMRAHSYGGHGKAARALQAAEAIEARADAAIEAGAGPSDWPEDAAAPVYRFPVEDSRGLLMFYVSAATWRDAVVMAGRLTTGNFRVRSGVGAEAPRAQAIEAPKVAPADPMVRTPADHYGPDGFPAGRGPGAPGNRDNDGRTIGPVERAEVERIEHRDAAPADRGPLSPLAALRHRVTGAIERGEAQAIEAIEAPTVAPAITGGPFVLCSAYPVDRPFVSLVKSYADSRYRTDIEREASYPAGDPAHYAIGGLRTARRYAALATRPSTY